MQFKFVNGQKMTIKLKKKFKLLFSGLQLGSISPTYASGFLRKQDEKLFLVHIGRTVNSIWQISAHKGKSV